MDILKENQMCNEIEKKLQRLQVLKKKKKLWGLNEKEEKEYAAIKLKYIVEYFELVDIIFIEYIEPFLFTNDIISKKTEIMEETGWEGNLLFKDKDIQGFLDNVKDKEKVIGILTYLKNEEIKQVEEFKNSEYGKKMLELFYVLNNIENESNFIINYIETRYEIMICLI